MSKTTTMQAVENTSTTRETQQRERKTDNKSSENIRLINLGAHS